MTASRPSFQPKVIAGLPDAFKPTPTEDQAHTIDQLEELKKHLHLKAWDKTTETIEGDITFSMLENESHSINDAFIANAFAFIHTQRETIFYKNIHKKITARQHLTPNEILYFSLITDDVNLLTEDMINTLQSTKNIYACTFRNHIDLLFCCKKLSMETNHTERTLIKKNSEDILKNRNLVKSQLSFCNLARVNFAGLGFNGSSFQWLNLENANFSNCTFNDCIFKDCLLNQANFQKSETSTTLPTQGISFLNCSLNKTNFSNTTLTMQAKGCQWNDTAFTKADLNANFSGCRLNDCHFNKAILGSQTSIDSLSLSGCDFSDAVLNTPIKSALTDTSVKLFTDSELNNSASLSEKLNMLLPPPTFDAKQLSNYRTVIAHILLNQLNDTSKETREKMITTALQHSLFASKNMLKQSLNGVVTFCGFFSTPLFETTAESLLKKALSSPTTPPLKNY